MAAPRMRYRHDGFTPERRKAFFKGLRKTGCIRDAARAAGISTNTVRRWRDKEAGFDEKVTRTLTLASKKLEMIAYQRATIGAAEKVYRGGKLVSTKVKPSDAMLRLLMQGANPGKYGRTGQAAQRGAPASQVRQEGEREGAERIPAEEARRVPPAHAAQGP